MLPPYILSTAFIHFTKTQTLAGLLLLRPHLCTQLATIIEHGTFGICSLEFTLSKHALVAAVVRGMLKTWITLRDVFCVLLNLACILLNLINISNVQRLLLPLNFTLNIHIFSLVHQLWLFLWQILFPCLISLVNVMICIFNWEEFIYGMFEDCIGLFNSHYRSFLFQNFYQVIPCYYGNSPKVSGHLFIINQHKKFFFEFIFDFDACCVSHKFTTYLCLYLCQK